MHNKLHSAIKQLHGTLYTKISKTYVHLVPLHQAVEI